MSYIAFELDALNKVGQVATAARIGVEWVTHGLVQMWAHCFRERVDTVSSMQIAGFFGAEAGPALAAFGFLERLESGWRVRGAQRYLRLREARSEGGKKGRATQLATAQKADAQAHPGQKRALKSPPEPGQNIGLQGSNEPGQKRALKSPPEPGQKRALSPNTESSSLREEEDSVEVPSSACAPSLPLPPPAGGAAEGAAKSSAESDKSSANRSVNAKPPKPPRPPKPVEGTPEYARAVAEGDWELLRWGPWAEKLGQEARP